MTTSSADASAAMSSRLAAVARITEAVRSAPSPATGTAFDDLLVTITEAVADTRDDGDRAVLWLVSRDGTRSRQVAPVRPGADWTPADGPVAAVLGARNAVEMGLADGETIGRETRAVARSTTDDDRRPNRSFGRFVPIRSGDRIGAVLGVIRTPGRPVFEREDRIVLDAAVERIENAFTTQALSDELASERTRGIVSGDGVLLSHALLNRLGHVSGDSVIRYLFNGSGMNFVSDGILTAIGYTSAEVMGDPTLIDRAIHPDDRHIITDLIADPALAERPLLIRFLRRNGQISWQLLRVVAMRDSCGRVIGVEGFTTDVTAMKLAEAELAHQARSDALTGLSNRLNFRDATTRALARVARHPGMLAVLFLDLDGFKLVNDTLGHAAGDDVLRTVSERLRKAIRREDLIARLGGDEFAVLLAEIRDVREATATARRVLEALEEPISVAGSIANISTGVGIAVTDDGRTDADDIINKADIALYQAKRVGRGRWQVFDGPSGSLAASPGTGLVTPDAPLADLGSLPPLTEGALRAALAGSEFRVAYLPIVDLVSGRISGVEALVRWQHPEYGLIPASAFIDQAASTEVIHPLGDWVLREASRQVAAWRLLFGTDVRLWVNVDSNQLSRSGFVETFLATLGSTGLPLDQVGVDAAESVFTPFDTANEHALSTLHRAGIKLAVDQFGLGGSSLRTLRKLPLTALKLDRSIVDGLNHDSEESLDLVRLAVNLADSLHAHVVAVGVDRKDQLEQVRLLRCAQAQGAVFGDARTPEEMADLLALSRPLL